MGSSVFLFGFFLFFGFAILGLFWALFRRGRRLRGLGVLALGLVASLASGIMMVDRQAVEAGWEGSADRQAARDAGIDDPVAFAPIRAGLAADRAEKAALVASEAEKAKADAKAARDADRALVAQKKAETEAALQAEKTKAAQEKADAAALIETEKVAAAAELRRKGFHCLSSWDGSHSDFKAAIKAVMRDPDSFEHMETRVTPADAKGQHAIFMTYRARNGFGGMNVGTASGTFSGADCVASVIAVE